MPVIVRTAIRRLSQAEFGELAHRHPGVQLEGPIEVTHATAGCQRRTPSFGPTSALYWSRSGRLLEKDFRQKHLETEK